MNPDTLFEITKNVKDVKSLVLMCSLNSQILGLCQNYSKQMFLSLMRNSSFRKSFYDTTEEFIKTNNFTALLSLMRWYPVGKLFPEHLSYMNVLQQELLKHTTQPYFKQIFQLLFYPSNYIQFDLHRIEEYFEYARKNPLFRDNFFKILTFHFSHSNKFKNLQKQFRSLIEFILAYLVSDSIEFGIEFLEQILDALFEADKTYFQLTLYTLIWKPSSELDIDIDSEEMQNIYADPYDYTIIKKWYSKYGLDVARRNYMRNQTGGSLLSLASTLVKTAAKNPLVQQLGKHVTNQALQQIKGPMGQQISKQVASQLGNPMTRQMGKQIATQLLQQASDNVIDNASKYATDRKASSHKQTQSNSWW